MFTPINGGKLPQRATRYSAAFDVFSNEDVVIGAGETKLVGLGITLDLKTFWRNASFITKLLNMFSISYFMKRHRIELHPRSSVRAQGLGGGVGVIDLDYANEIKLVLHNPLKYGKVPYNGREDMTTLDVIHFDKFGIYRGDKIGQLILCRHEGHLLPAEYTVNHERTGGFGSTSE